MTNNTDSVRVLASTPKASLCPRCGLPNKCAMEEGKSIHACWCSGEKIIDKHLDYEGCLCKTCLREIAEEIDSD